jgi:hypothetical protein
VIPVRPPRLSKRVGVWLLCSSQGSSEKACSAGRARWPDRRRHGLSKLNSMRGLEWDGMSTHPDGCSLGRPGSVDMLGRSGVAIRSSAASRPEGRCDAGRRVSVAGTLMVLPRKEVIQPQLPLRLPCYDFTPVTSPTFDGSLPCGLGHRLRVLLTPMV